MHKGHTALGHEIKHGFQKKNGIEKGFFLFAVNSKDFLKIIIYFINSLVSLSQ